MVLEFYWTFNRLPRFTQSWSANENDDGNTEIIKHRRIVCQIKEPEGNWATNNEKTIPTVFVQSRMEQLQVEWRSLEMISYFLPPDFANMRTIEFYWSDRYFYFFSLRKSKPVIHLSSFFFLFHFLLFVIFRDLGLANLDLIHYTICFIYFIDLGRKMIMLTFQSDGWIIESISLTRFLEHSVGNRIWSTSLSSDQIWTRNL